MSTSPIEKARTTLATAQASYMKGGAFEQVTAARANLERLEREEHERALARAEVLKAEAANAARAEEQRRQAAEAEDRERAYALPRRRIAELRSKLPAAGGAIKLFDPEELEAVAGAYATILRFEAAALEHRQEWHAVVTELVSLLSEIGEEPSAHDRHDGQQYAPVGQTKLIELAVRKAFRSASWAAFREECLRSQADPTAAFSVAELATIARAVSVRGSEVNVAPLAPTEAQAAELEDARARVAACDAGLAKAMLDHHNGGSQGRDHHERTERARATEQRVHVARASLESARGDLAQVVDALAARNVATD